MLAGRTASPISARPAGRRVHAAAFALEVSARKLDRAAGRVVAWISEEAVDALPQVGLVALVLAAGLLAWCLGRRRTATGAVRRALVDPDPEVRRAAVLVAANHGLGRYTPVLCTRVEREPAETVLLALAEATRARSWCHRRGRRARLARWAEAFAAAPCETVEAASEGRRDGRQGIDALAVMEAPPLDPQPPPPPPRREAGTRPPRHRWRALPDGLDALKVLDALPSATWKRASSTYRPKRRPPSGERIDIEAVLDGLAGVSPRRPRRHPVDEEAGARAEAS